MSKWEFEFAAGKPGDAIKAGSTAFDRGDALGPRTFTCPSSGTRPCPALA